MGRSGGAVDQDDRYTRAARLYGAAIERLARGYEADPELRRDLVQEIHAALWRSYAYFDGHCSERSWFYRIAHNVAVSHMIASRRRRPSALVGLDQVEDLAGTGNPEREAGDKRLVDQLLATIHRLAPADRQVMLLYLEDLTAAEIGEIIGLSTGAVAVRVHRLKALLAKPYISEEEHA